MQGSPPTGRRAFFMPIFGTITSKYGLLQHFFRNEAAARLLFSYLYAALGVQQGRIPTGESSVYKPFQEDL